MENKSQLAIAKLQIKELIEQYNNLECINLGLNRQINLLLTIILGAFVFFMFNDFLKK